MEHVYRENPETARRNLEALERAGLRAAGKRVLDLGCGSGTYAALLARAGAATVLGVDKEPGNIEQARRLNQAPGVEYLCADLETWPDWGRFDLVFLRGTIYYLSEPPARTLGRLRAHLLPGGELFLTFVAPSPRARLVNLCKRLAAALPRFLQPAARATLARVYLALVRARGDSRATLEEVRDKMSTLFFPLRHLVSQARAEEMLRDQGFAVLAVLGAQGQHPSLSDEFGILARVADAADQRPTPPGLGRGLDSETLSH